MLDDFNPYDMPAGTRVWVYLIQKDSSSSGSMERTIEELIQQKEWILGKVFHDYYGTEKSTNREAFKLMYSLARQIPRPADLLIVWDWPRFAGSQGDTYLYGTDLRRHGWKILSIEDTAISGSMAAIYKTLAEQIDQGRMGKHTTEL